MVHGIICADPAQQLSPAATEPIVATELSPTSYIDHHLSFRQLSLGDSPFWTLHLDTLVTSVILGVIAFGLLWLVVRGATASVPGKRQAFVELAVGFVDD